MNSKCEKQNLNDYCDFFIGLLPRHHKLLLLLLFILQYYYYHKNNHHLI